MAKFSMPVATFASFVIAIVFIIEGAHGVKCYYCHYTNINGTEQRGSDKSCESGNTPKSSLLFDCGRIRSMSLPRLTMMSRADGLLNFNLTLAGNGTMMPKASSSINWGCAKIVADGTYLGSKMKFTSRGCIGTYENPKKECKTKTLSEWNKGRDDWSEIVANVTAGYKSDTKIVGCYCAKDKCNGVPPLLTSFSSSILILVSSAAIGVSTALF